ncbi:MAG: acyl-CoA reductase [Chitinophagales bacterium]|nr:acyl-CoA reductase [Chitinophagales bacterium]MDW8394457.1 acyl-CoA reductase [Chitinophagales bacterium]
MVTTDQRISALAELGERLQPGYAPFAQAMEQAEAANPWFTRDNIQLAAEAIRSLLRPEALRSWLAAYPRLPVLRPRRLGLVLAGNIPLVGFHDFLCAFLSGHHLFLKLSSKDSVLFSFVLQELDELIPGLNQTVHVVERLADAEAVIATGSNTTSAYFRRYFGKVPHILRGHRNAAAILSGEETPDELAALGRDVFSYFGLGCRNVSKLLLPKGYPVAILSDYWQDYQHVIFHNKYRNNYDYYRAVFLINRVEHTAGPLVLLRNEPTLASPVAVLHYEFYEDEQALTAILQRDAPQLQCLVGRRHIPFGRAQFPTLTDYADGVDTLQFLSQL